jgi:hypothetical protein
VQPAFDTDKHIENQAKAEVDGLSVRENLKIDGRLLIWACRKGTIRLGDNVIINSRVGSNLVGLTKSCTPN